MKIIAIDFGEVRTGIAICELAISYHDLGEMQAENHNAMTMNDWVERLNAFLQFNGKEILKNAGKISQKVAQELAYKEYDKYRLKQDKIYVSDYDKFIEEIKMLENNDKNN